MEYTIDYTQSKLQEKWSYDDAAYNIYDGLNTNHKILRLWFPLIAIFGVLLSFLKLITLYFPKIFSSQSDTDVQKESSQSSTAETKQKPKSNYCTTSNIAIPQNKTDSTQDNANTQLKSNQGIVETDPDLQKKYCLELKKRNSEDHEFCKTVNASSEHSMRDRKTYSLRSRSKPENQSEFKMDELDIAEKRKVELIDPDRDLLGSYCAQTQNMPNITSTSCDSSSHAASSTQSIAESSRSSSTQCKPESKGVQIKKTFDKNRPLTSEFKQNLSELEIMGMQNSCLR